MNNELLVIKKPYSSFSEEIKRVRTNIKFSAVDEAVKVIMITSSVAGEGKSFMTANLATAFALNNEKVLIIDCDLRKGRQNKIFGIACEENEGFSNLLLDKLWDERYMDYVKPTKVKKLSIIPTGPYPPNPSELLASTKCKNLIDRYKQFFDVIILDCPPVLGLNDSLVVSTYADLSIIVAAHKKTPMDLLIESKKSLENVGAKKINVILNKVDSKDNPYYSSYYTNDEVDKE